MGWSSTVFTTLNIAVLAPIASASVAAAAIAKAGIAPEGSGLRKHLLARLVEPCPDPDAPCLLFREGYVPRRQHRLLLRRAAVMPLSMLLCGFRRSMWSRMPRRDPTVSACGASLTSSSSVAGASKRPMARTSLSHLPISVSSFYAFLAVKLAVLCSVDRCRTCFSRQQIHRR